MQNTTEINRVQSDGGEWEGGVGGGGDRAMGLD